MKKYLISLSLAILLSSCLLVYFLVNVSIKEMERKVMDKYYTSIQIENGDSLWSIAGEYRENSGMTTAQYVEELKNMNGLKEDTIHRGQYLTVMYVVSETD